MVEVGAGWIFLTSRRSGRFRSRRRRDDARLIVRSVRTIEDRFWLAATIPPRITITAKIRPASLAIPDREDLDMRKQVAIASVGYP
ncbi:MAG: hypothetical protein R2849_17575 [Thermomicrobiales bacterium]